jgi:hypothetical protein
MIDKLVLVFCVVTTILMLPVAVILDIRDQLRG